VITKSVEEAISKDIDFYNVHSDVQSNNPPMSISASTSSTGAGFFSSTLATGAATTGPEAV